jgi:hypothetical protein
MTEDQVRRAALLLRRRDQLVTIEAEMDKGKDLTLKTSLTWGEGVILDTDVAHEIIGQVRERDEAELAELLA